MNKHYEALELPKILEKLANLTACADAHEAALALEPQTEYYEAQRLLRENRSGAYPHRQIRRASFGGLQNVNGALRRAEAGATLTMRALLDIAGVLRAVRGICTWREKSAGTESALDDLFGSLYANKYLEDLICNAILSEEEMSDNASPQLKTSAAKSVRRMRVSANSSNAFCARRLTKTACRTHL